MSREDRIKLLLNQLDDAFEHVCEMVEDIVKDSSILDKVTDEAIDKFEGSVFFFIQDMKTMKREMKKNETV